MSPAGGVQPSPLPRRTSAAPLTASRGPTSPHMLASEPQSDRVARRGPSLVSRLLLGLNTDAFTCKLGTATKKENSKGFQTRRALQGARVPSAHAGEPGSSLGHVGLKLRLRETWTERSLDFVRRAVEVTGVVLLSDSSDPEGFKEALITWFEVVLQPALGSPPWREAVIQLGKPLAEETGRFSAHLVCLSVAGSLPRALSRCVPRPHRAPGDGTGDGAQAEGTESPDAFRRGAPRGRPGHVTGQGGCRAGGKGRQEAVCLGGGVSS